MKLDTKYISFIIFSLDIDAVKKYDSVSLCNFSINLEDSPDCCSILWVII